MKKKIFSVLFALVLALSLCLVTAVPVAAAEPATLLSSTGLIGQSNADTIIVDVPAGTTLGQIDSIAWSEYLIQGYPPHVDIMLDLDEDGGYDEALVFEYANNGHAGDSPPNYGALTGAWYQTFSDDTEGPAVVDDDALGWLATGAPGGPPATIPIAYGNTAGQFVIGTLAQWQAGQVVTEIDADTIVVQLEIEVDNYITDCVALVDNIEVVIAGGLVEMTVSSPGEIIGVSVNPTSVDFGSIVPGTASESQTVTVTNTGNVAENFGAEIFNESVADFYTINLTIDALAVSGWSAGPIAALGDTGLLPLVLMMPSGTPADTYTATLVFWAEMAP